ncbi:Mitochondrial import receptor subunit TOM70 [Candida viswanathii]|uniref:Mitochondrial import receptor subunit TOM70 n=1 Tax=Candida viswanathii TaxID=5486 RepID=A0A367YK85_9ASCO|nr:Mitochondrial import receptor subunit TOM70 [Candida viswanathii]
MSDNFFIKNKTAIIVTALTAFSAAGAYYYYTQQQQTSSTGKSDKPSGQDSTSTKKKSKKSKKSKATPEPSASAQDEKSASNVISKLSDAEKEEWAMQLKEDGNNEFKNKEYKRAIEFYSAALDLKHDPIYYSNRSACYAALEDHDNVIKDTTEAIKMKPDYTKCILRRATSYEVLEQYEDAMFDLTALTIYGGFSNKSIEQVLERVLRKHSIKIVEQKPKTLALPSAATIGSFFGAFVEETEPEGINESSEGADTLINQAVSSLEDSDPVKAVALEYLAAFQFLKNDPSSAFASIEKAIALKPRARSYVFRALINADKSSYDAALKDFKTAEDLDPECPDIFYHLGQLYYLTGDLTNAETNFNKAKDLHPDNVYAYIQLACITYKNGQIDSANEKFTEAKLKFPTSPEVPNYYGEILADKGDIQGACKQFEIASRLQEKLDRFSVGALPLINEATVISRESLEKIGEAEELLTKACAIDPKSELARISLAQIKLQKDEVDDAVLLFEESSDLARSIEEKIQATSFAEATKMQKRIKNDPVLNNKIAELMRGSGAM